MNHDQKRIQILSEENKALQAENELLRKRLQELEYQLDKLRKDYSELKFQFRGYTDDLCQNHTLLQAF